MRKEHRWGPSGEFGSSSRRIVALLLPFDTPGTAPAGHPFGTRRIGAHVGSAATVRACLSRSCCRLLPWSLPSGASRSGYARSNANSAPSDRHCVGRPPRPSPPTTSCASDRLGERALLSSRMPVCDWVDAPGRGPRTRTDVGSIDTWEISAAANCSSSSSLPSRPGAEHVARCRPAGRPVRQRDPAGLRQVSA